MTSHMTALGFPVTTEQDFRHYVYQATEFGQKLETPNGSYTVWKVDHNIELWVQTNLHKRIIGMHPHFYGNARMRIGLIKRIYRNGQTILDGSFYAFADPTTDDPTSGRFPFVFDAPDYDLYQQLHLPEITDVQLAAFAYHLHGYPIHSDYKNSINGEQQLPESSAVACDLFDSKGVLKKHPPARITLTGRILHTAQLTNPVTNQKFYWAYVQTPGGDIDVVADPQIVQGKLVPQGLLSGTFWLSGRLV